MCVWHIEPLLCCAVSLLRPVRSECGSVAMLDFVYQGCALFVLHPVAVMCHVIDGKCAAVLASLVRIPFMANEVSSVVFC